MEENEAGRRVAVVVDDDPDVRSLIEQVLIQSGFETIGASNGRDGVELVRKYQPLITTLDVNMPGMDGFATARLIREVSSTYILMLTALDEEIDVVEGLGSGADDYLVKPFRVRELRARVESVLRRPRDTVNPQLGASPDPVPTMAQPAAPAPVATPAPAPAPAPETLVMARGSAAPEAPVAAPPRVQPAPQGAPVQTPAAGPAVAAPAPVADPDGEGSLILEHNGLTLDPATRIASVDGRGLTLTRSEFDLLQTLLEAGRRVRSKADLVLALRGEDYVTHYYVTDADKRAIEVHMANVRRKLNDSATEPRWIETVRGVGYRLAAAQ